MRFVLFFEAAQIGSGPRCAGVRTGPPRQSPQWPCAGFPNLKMVKVPRWDCTFANVPNAFSFFKSHFQNIRVASEIRHFTKQTDVIPSRYASISSKNEIRFSIRTKKICVWLEKYLTSQEEKCANPSSYAQIPQTDF